MAHTILGSDQASYVEKSMAGLYTGGMLLSHTTMAAGVFLLSPAGATIGIAFGGVPAGIKYGLASSGACGCELQQEVERLGVGYIGREATKGLFGGGLLGPIYKLGGWGKLALGSFGALLSGGGLYVSGRNIIEGFRSGDIKACNFVDAGSSIVGLALSGLAIKKGVNQIRGETVTPLVKYNPKAGRFYDASTGKFIKFDDVPYPKEPFINSKPGMAKPGQLVDRFGPEKGSWLSPKGTPHIQRGIAEGITEYHAYKVIKTFPWTEGLAAREPGFGSPGGGYQYNTAHPIWWLVKFGFLERLP